MFRNENCLVLTRMSLGSQGRTMTDSSPPSSASTPVGAFSKCSSQMSGSDSVMSTHPPNVICACPESYDATYAARRPARGQHIIHRQCVLRPRQEVRSHGLHDQWVDVVLLDVGVSGHERQTLDLGLRDQHAVERVAMVDGQPSRRDRMRKSDRQLTETHITYAFSQIGRATE